MKFLTWEQLIECVKLEIHWKATARFWELLFENHPESRYADVTTISKKDWDSWCVSLERDSGGRVKTTDDWSVQAAIYNYPFRLKDYQYTERSDEVYWFYIDGDTWELFIRPFSSKTMRGGRNMLYLYEVREFLEHPEAWKLKFFDHNHSRWNKIDNQIIRAQERVTDLTAVKERIQRRKKIGRSTDLPGE